MPFRTAYRETIAERLRDDREWREYAFGALEVVEKNPGIFVKFSNGTVRKLEFWDMYCQTDPRADISLEEKIMTGIAWQHVLRRDYIYVVYQLREGPRSDTDIQGNNDILQDMVRRYRNVFSSAEFWGGTQGEDGQVTFKTAAIPDFWGMEDNGQNRIDLSKITGPKHGRCQSFPLEVGYCRPDQVDTHLLDSRCVARFPYGYDLIIFLEDLTERADWVTELLGSLEKILPDSSVDATGQLSFP